MHSVATALSWSLQCRYVSACDVRMVNVNLRSVHVAVCLLCCLAVVTAVGVMEAEAVWKCGVFAMPVYVGVRRGVLLYVCRIVWLCLWYWAWQRQRQQRVSAMPVCGSARGYVSLCVCRVSVAMVTVMAVAEAEAVWICRVYAMPVCVGVWCEGVCAALCLSLVA